jgi:glycosyltransferase A (GT-A) superfamily protein (DUF2064 family)
MRRLVGEADAMRFEAQVAGDLGHRAAAGLELATLKHDRALMLAVDSPDVPSTHVLNCAAALNDAQTVLGLSHDGGYWCIGAQRGVDFPAWLHRGIEWSTERTAEQTLAAARRLGYSTQAGQMWDDVDWPDDLRKLLRRLSVSSDPVNARLLGELRAILPAGFLKGTQQPQ